MKQTKFAKALALCLGVLVFSGAISYLIFAWTAPASTPPGDNVDAPINVGNTAQGKMGNLGINTTNPQAKLDIADSSTVAGSQFLRIGDDTFFTDIDTANTIGIYGQQDDTIARIKLGSNGGIISSYDNNIGIGTDTPTEKLEVADGKIKTPMLCLDDICRSQWPEGPIPSECPTGEWVIGINADGTVKCNGGAGTPPWPTSSCVATSDETLTASQRKRVFVTSNTYYGHATDSATEVDAICQNEAQSAGLTGTYKALLYLSGQRNPQNVLASNYIFVHCGMESGKAIWHEIANSPASMLGTTLPFPIKYSATGSLVGGTSGVKVWANFQPTGGGETTNYSRCWVICTSLNCNCGPGHYRYKTSYGQSSYNNIRWAFGTQEVCDCNDAVTNGARGLYCIQQ